MAHAHLRHRDAVARAPEAEERPDPQQTTSYCKNPLSEISADPTPVVGLPNPSSADSDVVLGVLREDGPHLEVTAQGSDVPA